MRQTIKEIETNNAYRWFIGYDFSQPIPHFSTLGKNYVRRFQDTNLFESIFARILEEAVRHGFVEPDVLFIDATNQVTQDRLGLPVLSAATSTVFKILKKLNLKTEVPNAGHLLSGKF